MSKIETVLKAHALVSATIERKAPNAFAVLKEAASRTRDLAVSVKHEGTSQEVVDTVRDIAKSLSTLAAAFDGSVKVEGEARVVTEEQLHAYLGKEMAAALSNEDALEAFNQLATLKAMLSQATVDDAGEIKMVFTGEIEGTSTFHDVAKALDDRQMAACETAWPADMNSR